MTETQAIQSINHNNQCSFIALIDSKLNNRGQIMSIAIVIVDSKNYHVVNFNYYIISPEYQVGGSYSYALNLPGIENKHYSKEYALLDIVKIFDRYHIKDIYGYNISQAILSIKEFESYDFYDVGIVATQSYYNQYIDPRGCDEKGFLKGPKDLNAILVLVSDDYSVTHNALMDCVMILELMIALDLPVAAYNVAKVQAIAPVVPSISSDQEDLILPEVDYFTMAQTAHILGIPEYQVEQLILSKKLKAKKHLGKYQIYKIDLKKYIHAKRRRDAFIKHIVLYILALILIIVGIVLFVMY